MKTDKQLDDLLLALYWHCEHGEHQKAIKKLRQLEKEAVSDSLDSYLKKVDEENEQKH